MGYHMHEVEGAPKPLEITHVEHTLTSLQIFDILDRKLAAKEKAELYHQPAETRNYARGVNASYAQPRDTFDQKK